MPFFRKNGRFAVFILFLIVSVLILIGVVALFFREPPIPSNPPESVDVVIARYKEPIDWLDRYKHYPIRNLYIYNKSDTPISCPAFKPDCHIESLPNVGVCDHTYLYHILKTYDDPASMTIFLPASVMAKDYKRRTLPIVFKKAFANKPCMAGRPITQPVHVEEGALQMKHYVVNDTRNRSADSSFDLAPASPRPFGTWYKVFFPDENVRNLSLTGMFAVTKEMIHANDIGLYKRLIATVEKDTFPEAAHYMERSWSTVFKTIPREDFI
jgi:hypothetical protein